MVYIPQSAVQNEISAVLKSLSRVLLFVTP